MDNVKILQFRNADDSGDSYGEIMDTFVFKSTVNLNQICEQIKQIYEKSNCSLSYYEIVTENFKNDLVKIENQKSILW